MASTVKAYSLKADGLKAITPNFKVREFACKDGSDAIFVSDELVSILQQIRTKFGKPVVINSAFRTPTHNKSVGGATTSQHLYGLAADIRIDGISPKTIYNYVETLMPNKGGIGLYPTFVHVDVRPNKTRF